jgi:hypothetical protein
MGRSGVRKCAASSEQNLAPGTEFAACGCWIGGDAKYSWADAVALNRLNCTEPLAV